MARLLFLGASVSQLPAIRYAKARGDTVIACDGDPAAVAFPLCDVAEVVSFSDVDAVLEVAVRHRAEGVLAVCTDRAVLPAAEVAERLGLAGIAPAVAKAMSHKPTMRAQLAQAGVPQPPYAVVTKDGAFGEAGSGWSAFPAVVKPADSGGQRGLSLVRRPSALGPALEHAFAMSRTGEAMLEAYVEGLELNLLFAVRDGKASTLIASDRLRPPGVGFGVGWIHSFPSSLEPDQLDAVERAAAAAVEALGLRDGIAFPQVLWTDDGPMVVEVAARIAAGQMADLVRHATGIEIYEIAIRQALGEEVPDALVERRDVRPVAIRFLTASPGLLPVGKVTAIERLDEVRAAPGVLDAGLYFEAGATIEPLRVDADRRGYVIATAETAEDALRQAEAAARLLRVETEQPGALRRVRALRPERGTALTLVPVVCALLLFGTIGGFTRSGHTTIRRALVAGIHVTPTFSPACRCADRIAHITFRVLHRSPVELRIVDARGRVLDTLGRVPETTSGVIRAVWTGRTAAGGLARPGVYYPQVVFRALHRQLQLPDPITVDRAARTAGT